MTQENRYGVLVTIEVIDNQPLRWSMEARGTIVVERLGQHRTSDDDGKFRAQVGEVLTGMIRKARFLSDGTDGNRTD